MTQNRISTLETQRATAHAWRAYFERHETKKAAGIHYDMIIDAAEEYLFDRAYMFNCRVKNGYTKYMQCYIDRYPDIKGAYKQMEISEAKLDAMCDLVGISANAAIKIARIRLRGYYRNNMITLCHEDGCRKALDRIA